MIEEATHANKSMNTMKATQKQGVEVTEAEVIEETSAEAKGGYAKKSWGERLTSPEHWLRFVFMVLFVVISGVVGYVVTAIVALNFILALVAGQCNDNLRRLGGSLSLYIYQILRFLTYNTEDKPFPFADWPETEDRDSP